VDVAAVTNSTRNRSGLYSYLAATRRSLHQCLSLGRLNLEVAGVSIVDLSILLAASMLEWRVNNLTQF
jgi:hypothetical protein